MDIKLIRTEPELVKKSIRKRNMDADALIDKILATDKKRRDLIGETEARKARQNKVSKEIAKLKKERQDTTSIMNEMKALSAEIKALYSEFAELETAQKDMLLSLPNLPDEDVPSGGKENNEPMTYYKDKPRFDFRLRDHVELCESLGMVDYERGAKLSGAGSWIYKGVGAKLEWALINFFMDEHTKDGYEFILPPHMLSYNCGYVAGQFPKFRDEVYWIGNPTGSEDKFLLPTAETALVNLHAEEILEEQELPKKYFAYTPCYRREAGSYRSQERGMIRGHQFNKVEMVQYAKPEESMEAFNELVKKAETLVQKLGLHYRSSKLAAGDCSFSMARTNDIEVWIPSMEIYKEVSSASNANDYQARRGNIKYRDKDKKLHFVHTLNASGLATSRLLPAIVEQHQNEDGSVNVPEVLRKYMGIDKIVK